MGSTTSLVAPVEMTETPEVPEVPGDDEAGPSRPSHPPPKDPKDPDTECPVCCESYTRAIRKPIECSKCEYAACMNCCKRHLTLSVNASCMACNHPWDYEFISTHFPIAWIGSEYRAHREKILVDREVAQLPASQHLVLNFKMATRLAQDMHDLNKEKALIKRRLQVIDIERWNKRNRHGRIVASQFQNNGLGDLTEEQAADMAGRTFIRACPVEDCRGFLSSALKCGTCEGWACGECFGIIGATRDAPHTCNEDDVKTAKMIKRETKPCPRCAISIYKLEGCSQMWCVSCRTPFCWRTGKIIEGQIHNPEYFRYLRENAANGEIPRQPGDVAGGGGCDNRANIRYLDQAVRLQQPAKDVHDYIFTVHRIARHVENMEIPQLARRDAEISHADLRLLYLTHKITKDEWKRLLLLREKRREKEISLRNVYEMFVEVTNEIQLRFIANSTPIAPVVQEIMKVVEYTNTCLNSVRKRFNNCTAYSIRAFPPLTITHAGAVANALASING